MAYKSDYDAAANRAGGKAANKGSYRGKVEQGQNQEKAQQTRKIVNQNVKTKP